MTQRALPSAEQPLPESEAIGQPMKHALKSDKPGVPAVRRASAILWHLARHPEGMVLSHIARDLDIVPSTCLHILRELISARLVTSEANGKLYRLGSGILSLAWDLTRHNVFVQAALPYLNRLAREQDVSASAQERDGDDDMLVVATSVAAATEGAVRVGSRVPCLASAMGRLVAAYSGWSDTELHLRFKRIRWQNPPKFSDWLSQVNDTRDRRYAIDEGNFRKGVTAFAAGIFTGKESLDRTISIAVVSAQLDVSRRDKLIDSVQVAAADISAALG